MPASENQNHHQPGSDPLMDNEVEPDDDETPLQRSAWARVLWVLIAVIGVISALGTLTIVVQIARLWWAL